jgi:hypothetical protein
MTRTLLPLLFTLTLMTAVLVPQARADQANREILFRTDAPIEVPGRVLDPGRYELKLVGINDHVAGLWNARGSKFYGFFDTIPVDRQHAGKLKVDLSGSGENAPKRLSEWFYPGDKTGYELLYPNSPMNLEAGNHITPNQRVKG